MDSWKIEATKHTPETYFDATNNVFSMKGESYPENVEQISKPLFTWWANYLAQINADQALTVNIELTYFNSSSSKMLLDLFDRLEEAAATGNQITVNWIYEADNDSAEEFGEEFKEDLETLTFNLVKQ
jgi:acyl-CoA thioesterase FadM